MSTPIRDLYRRFKREWDRLRRLPLTREYNGMLAEPDPKTRFDRIYRRGIWKRIAKDSESLSGGGSSFDRTAAFRNELQSLLSSREPGVFFDAPCGDFNFMRHVRFPDGWRYIGGDIAPSLIADMRQRYPDVAFREFDITSDSFPSPDIWLCRDCLFHLSFADIRAALENFARSDGKIAIITNHIEVAQNRDITTGDFRPLDLTLAPFGLPKPREVLADFPGQVAAIWTREEIASALR